jgi:thiol-disulfide isomerase/thioredoxin
VLDARRRRFVQAAGLGATGLAAAAGLTWIAGGITPPYSRPSSHLQSLTDGRQWLNTPPLAAEDLLGKVLLVNFWTYSCINSLRPLPYLSHWARKYQDRGLIVIGAHTPEFEFEHDIERVRRAVGAQGITFPVVLDDRYDVWSTFGNVAWPGFYFLDADGVLRHRALGEGAYDRAERWIQRLLSQAQGARVGDAIVDVTGEGVQAAADWNNIHSPETYVGYVRASNFVSGRGLITDRAANYEAAPVLTLNHWSLCGSWSAGPEYAQLIAPGGAIKFRFRARDLNLVLGRGANTQPVRCRVTIDGLPPGDHRGVDVDPEGWTVLDEDRMYQLVRQRRRIQERDFEISFQEPGVRAYVFTFG